MPHPGQGIGIKPGFWDSWGRGEAVVLQARCPAGQQGAGRATDGHLGSTGGREGSTELSRLCRALGGCSRWECAQQGSASTKPSPVSLPVLHTRSSRPHGAEGDEILSRSSFYISWFSLTFFSPMTFCLVSHPQRVGFLPQTAEQTPHFPSRPGQSCPTEGSPGVPGHTELLGHLCSSSFLSL